MAYRYKLKLFPIVILITLLTLIIVFCVYITRKDKPITEGNVSASQSDSDVEPSSSGDTTSLEESEVGSVVESQQSSNSQQISSSSQSESKKPSANNLPWNLILVNRSNPLSNELNINKVKIDSQYVDSRAGEYYIKMRDDAKKDGIDLFLRSGYRSFSTQKINYNSSYNSYIKSGKDHQTAKMLTEQYYARPGESEHHTGLAMDIISVQYHNDILTLDERFAKTEAFKWLDKNAASYGFILRYPKDKVDVTKINYEPWHYRYVGVEHAKLINEKKICLEEYIQSLK